MKHAPPVLHISQSLSAQVVELGANSWRLEIAASPKRFYRLAQLDDYARLPRGRLPWQAPLRLSLRGRASADGLPGTWGFGLWNDPFSLSLGLGGMSQRFPALPRAAWFFYASPQNYLSFRDDLPAQGFLAATFAAASLPAPMMAIGSLLLPLMLIPAVGKRLRQVVRGRVAQGAGLVEVDVTQWHSYALEWLPGGVEFWIDEKRLYATPAAPGGRLGLVLWIDNQYAAWAPDGKLRYGFLANPQPAYVEIADFSIKD